MLLNVYRGLYKPHLRDSPSGICCSRSEQCQHAHNPSVSGSTRDHTALPCCSQPLPSAERNRSLEEELAQSVLKSVCTMCNNFSVEIKMGY